MLTRLERSERLTRLEKLEVSRRQLDRAQIGRLQHGEVSISSYKTIAVVIAFFPVDRLGA